MRSIILSTIALVLFVSVVMARDERRGRGPFGLPSFDGEQQQGNRRGPFRPRPFDSEGPKEGDFSSTDGKCGAKTMIERMQRRVLNIQEAIRRLQDRMTELCPNEASTTSLPATTGAESEQTYTTDVTTSTESDPYNWDKLNF